MLARWWHSFSKDWAPIFQGSMCGVCVYVYGHKHISDLKHLPRYRTGPESCWTSPVFWDLCKSLLLIDIKWYQSPKPCTYSSLCHPAFQIIISLATSLVSMWESQLTWLGPNTNIINKSSRIAVHSCSLSIMWIVLWFLLPHAFWKVQLFQRYFMQWVLSISLKPFWTTWFERLLRTRQWNVSRNS